jgi:hypothetical protein
MPSPTLPSSRRFVTQLVDSLSAPPQVSGEAITPASNPLNHVSDNTRKQLLTLQVLFPNEFVPALDLLDRSLVTRFRIVDGSELAATAPNVHGHLADAQVEQNAEQSVRNTAETMHDGATTLPIAEDLPEVEGSAQTSLNTTYDHRRAHVDEQAQYPTTQSQDTIYYVRSAQQRSSRFGSSYDTSTSYEVRLHAWNCSCPAFAFAAFPAAHSEPSVFTHNVEGMQDVLAKQTRRDKMAEGWLFGGMSLGDGMPPVCKHLLACVLVERCGGLFGGFVEERNVGLEEAAGWTAGWGD